MSGWTITFRPSAIATPSIVTSSWRRADAARREDEVERLVVATRPRRG